ncbi:MAG: hypothetical protein IPJ37_16435 [Bacteroidales bacterium]|nr:hypothetical protein [Bacteroidales bacterium]
MENLKFVFKSFLTFGLSYFLISCATTSMDTGGQSPKDKAAIIKNLGDGNVIEVDGKSLSEGKAFLPRTLELSSESIS